MGPAPEKSSKFNESESTEQFDISANDLELLGEGSTKLQADQEEESTQGEEHRQSEPTYVGESPNTESTRVGASPISTAAIETTRMGAVVPPELQSESTHVGAVPLLSEPTALHSLGAPTDLQSESTHIGAIPLPSLQTEATRVGAVPVPSIQSEATFIGAAPISSKSDGTRPPAATIQNLQSEATFIGAAPNKSDLRVEATAIHQAPPKSSKELKVPKEKVDVDVLAPGVMLGEYRVEACVGGGGMGEIWKGTHPKISKSVAIKVLRESLLHNEVAVARFLQEARSVNEIRHRNIVDIFSFGELSDGRPYFVMEFLEGKTLAQYIQDHGPLPFSEIVSIFGQLCRALQAVHDRGIVHRDLKPENIFLLEDESGEPFIKILDFGVAKLMAPGAKGLTRVGAMIGTPAYMSPEQCEGLQKVDHRTDIYAIGVLLFELITGRTPFEEPSEGSGSVLVKQMSMKAPKPSSMVKSRDIPAAVDQFAMSLLEKDPDDRPQRCADLPAVLLKAVGELRNEFWDQMRDPTPIYTGGFGVVKKKPSKSSQQGDYYSGSASTKPIFNKLRRVGWPLAVVAFMLLGILIGGYLQKPPPTTVTAVSENKTQPIPVATAPITAPVTAPAATLPEPKKEEMKVPIQNPIPKNDPPQSAPTASNTYASIVDSTVQKLDFSSCKTFGEGRILTKLVINAKGKVTRVIANGTELGDCVSNILKKTKFPAGGNEFSYSYPVFVN
jgi:serine/threonine protein kinase